MKSRFIWRAVMVAFGVISTFAARDAAPCGNPFWNPHCHDATQACQNGCPVLACASLVSNFDKPANAFSTSFFAGAIGHCASRAPDRNAILACAWQEVAANYPEVAGNTCMKNGLFATQGTQDALLIAIAPKPCPLFSCNTAFRKRAFECPLRDDLSCDAAVSQLDGQNGYFWKAVGHCNNIGTDRGAIGACAWNETIGKYAGMANSACVKQRLLASASTSMAIDAVVLAWQNYRCSIPRDFAHPDQGGCNHLEQCAPGCTTNASVTLNCGDSASELDGTGRFFWNAVSHCLRDGMQPDPAMVASCAWTEVIGKYPNLASQACIKDRLVNSPTGSQAIASVVRAVGFVAHNKMTVRFTSCANPAAGCVETCDLPPNRTPSTPSAPVAGSVPAGYFEPLIPQNLLDTLAPANHKFNEPPAHNIGLNEGRLRSDLRAVARLADPLRCSLPLAATQFALGTAEEAARAYADLSVTGHNAFAKFSIAPPDDGYCEGLHTTKKLPKGCPNIGTAPNDAALLNGCLQALDRAYKVANFLRAGETLHAPSPWFMPDGSLNAAAPAERTRKTNDRKALGWIAVSGEDDKADRPVNVPSSDFPQYDLDVDVEAPLARAPNPTIVPMHTRYIVAQSNAPAPAFKPATEWTFPTSHPVPTIAPDAEVLLFIHGMDSRAEEADDIIKALFKNPSRSAKNLVVISVDLPTSGYAENLDFERVSLLSEIGSPKLTPLPIPIVIPPPLTELLRGVPGFALVVPPGVPLVIPPGTPIPDFAATGKTPLLDFIEAFVVRFVERLDEQVPFKNNIKAVMGGSLGGNITFRLGRRPNVPWLPNFVVWSPASIWNSLGEGADITKHLAPRVAWTSANNRDLNDPNDLTPQRIGLRQAFFGSWDQPIVPLIIPQAQSDTWTSDLWPCKKSAIAGARLERHEMYDPRFLSWHWRLAAEQLLYSHQTIDPTTNQPRFMSNTKRMLLACGTDDHVPYNDICPATQSTAPNMTMTPGRALFLDKTGHSLDNERRTFWAQQLIEFLGL
jgi:hypothetical protein